MADLSVTAANVLKGASTDSPTSVSPAVTTFNAGVTITAGQSLYADTSVSPPVWRLSQCDGTAIESRCDGIALNGGAAGQPVTAQTAGAINVGATLANGALYCVSAAAGGICPIHDLVATNRLTIIGWSSSASLLQLTRLNTEKALAADVT